MPYQHGITVTEVTTGARVLVPVATAVIGLVATGPDADAAVFPLDRPALVLDLAAAIGKAGATGTLRAALQAIADQVDTPVVVVRVAPGADAAATNVKVIGGVVNGVKTGLQALLAAEAQVGVRPRIIGCPGLDTQPVTTALVVVAQKLRAMAYAAAVGADSAAAIIYRANFSARELMLLYPDFQALDGAGAVVTSTAVARALGLRARIDKEQGWHKSISNVAVNGVVGLAKDVGFDIQDAGCEANLLNAAQVTAAIRGLGGFRLWGSRTAVEPTSPFSFEPAVRTAQVLMDTIAGGLAWAIDKPLRPSLVKDIVETINGQMRDWKAEGRIIDGLASFDPAKNTTTTLSAGKVLIDYDYTPVPPLENLLLSQRITDSYLADFAAGLSA
jgi:hypothetical protein